MRNKVKIKKGIVCYEIYLNGVLYALTSNMSIAEEIKKDLEKTQI